MRFDVIIVGSGPAGLSAALNCKVRNKSVKVFGNSDLSEKITKAPMIHNYLGLDGVTGMEMKDAFFNHISSHDISINTERVQSVYHMGDFFIVDTDKSSYEATTVILSSGMAYKKPIKNEESFIGRGIGYCATCDAALYKGKTVCIINYNEDYFDDLVYTAELCDKVYYVKLHEGKFIYPDNVEVIKGLPKSFEGEGHVERLVLDSGEVYADGFFVLKDSVSPGQIAPGLKMSDKKHIDVDRHMATNIKGLFACGDNTGKPYQYMKAAGEGLTAGHSAVRFIDEMRSNYEIHEQKTSAS